VLERKSTRQVITFAFVKPSDSAREEMTLKLLLLLKAACISFVIHRGSAISAPDLARDILEDESTLKSIYFDHKLARESGEESELDRLLQRIDQEEEEEVDEKFGSRSILTIMADDQGNGDIGYNDATFHTPTLDFLSGRGVRFTNFHVQCTCSPTRAALLTGLYVTHTGLQVSADLLRVITSQMLY
jgi:hypothetical protein